MSWPLIRNGVLILAAIAAGNAILDQYRPRPLAGQVLSPVRLVPLQDERQTSEVFIRNGYQLSPVARYTVRGAVLGTERYRFDRGSAISPVDFVIGWGPMSSPTLVSRLALVQRERQAFFTTLDDGVVDANALVTTAAVVHIVPANGVIRDTVLKVQPGNTVRMTGWLINVAGPDGWRWSTSLRRDDTGPHSGEILFVEEIDVVP